MNENERESLIETVIELELEMFLRVPAERPASCMERPDMFKLHRRAQFGVWPYNALESYRLDLIRAKACGRNLMTEKYAVMQGLVPPGGDADLIDRFTALQMEWQEEVIRKYPKLMAGGRPLRKESDGPGSTSFETYLKGELSTYSSETLKALLDYAEARRGEGENPTEGMYLALVRALGYDDLDAFR